MFFQFVSNQRDARTLIWIYTMQKNNGVCILFQLYWNALSNMMIAVWLLGDSNDSHKFSWFVSGVHKCLQPTLVDIFDIVWCHQESMYDAVKTNIPTYHHSSFACFWQQ